MTTNPEPYARFITKRLLKTLPPGCPSARAVSETEIPIQGDDWFWADDNAKILELLSLPDIWRADPAAVSDVIDFLCAMCDGPLIFRRMAMPRLEVGSQEDGRLTLTHSLMDISCDLAKGQVVLGARYHDGRTTRSAILSGNRVTFKWGGITYDVSVDLRITSHAVEKTRGGLKLSWTAPIEVGMGKQRVGVVTYTCTVLGASMFVDFEAAFEIAPKVSLSDVTLSFGFEDLSHNENDVRYEFIFLVRPDGTDWKQGDDHTEPVNVPLAGLRYWSVGQKSHQSGFAMGIHSLPHDGSRISALKGLREPSGALKTLRSVHKFPGRQKGRLVAGERKVITSGGFYWHPAIYAEALARLAPKAGKSHAIDYSVSYDYGAELNAIARCLKTLKSPDCPLAPAQAAKMIKRLTAQFKVLDEAYETYFFEPATHTLNAIFSRSLAYYAYAHAELLEAGFGEQHSRALRRACDMLIGFERINQAIDGSVQSAFLMGVEQSAEPYVDCHAACLLALARGCTLLGENAWISAMDRALNAFCIKTIVMHDRRADIVGVDCLYPDGDRRVNETFWNFKAGICLQLFGALRRSRNPDLQGLWAKHQARLEIFEGVLQSRIRHSTRDHGEDGLEILTAMGTGETNSETQPWCAVGLIGEALC